MGVDALDAIELHKPHAQPASDIVVPGRDPDIIEAISPRLARYGVLAIIADQPQCCRVRVDVAVWTPLDQAPEVRHVAHWRLWVCFTTTNVGTHPVLSRKQRAWPFY